MGRGGVVVSPVPSDVAGLCLHAGPAIHTVPHLALLVPTFGPLSVSVPRQPIGHTRFGGAGVALFEVAPATGFGAAAEERRQGQRVPAV